MVRQLRKEDEEKEEEDYKGDCKAGQRERKKLIRRRRGRREKGKGKGKEDVTEVGCVLSFSLFFLSFSHSLSSYSICHSKVRQ